METLPENEVVLNDSVPKRRRWPLLLAVLLVLGIVGWGIAVRQLETKRWEAGQVAVAAGKWETAVTEFNALLQLWPPFVRQHTVEATALRGVAQYQQQSLAEAQTDFADALLADTNQIDIVGYQADSFFQQGDFEQAKIGALTTLAQPELLPDHLQAKLNANLALLPPEMMTDADRETAVAAALSLANYLPEETVAELHTMSAEYALADPEATAVLSAIDQALTLEDVPLTEAQQARLLPSQAHLLAEMDRWPDALAVSETALALADELGDDEIAALHQLRGQIYFGQGDLETAVAEAELALELDDSLAWPHAVLGWQAYRLFDYDTALAEADLALAQDAGTALAHRVQGGVFTWEGKINYALDALDLALQNDSDDVEAMGLRLFNLLEVSALDEAAELGEKATDLQPNAPVVLWIKAMLAVEDKDSPLALATINQAIELDNGRPEFYFLRANQYPFESDQDKVAADLEASLALNPEFAPAIMSQLYLRGRWYDFADIEETREYVLERWPNWYRSHLFQAYYYQFVARDIDQAITAVNQAIDLLPERADTYNLRGFLYLEQGKFDEARADFDTVAEMDPQISSLYYGLATLASEDEDSELTRDYLEQAVSVSNNSVESRIDLAFHLLWNDGPEMTWEMANQILAEDDSAAGAYVLRAMVHQFEQNYRRALADVNRALDMNPQLLWAHFIRAEILLANEQYDEAKETAEQLFVYEPDAYEVHRLLFFVAINQDDFEEAERQLELYLEKRPEFVQEYGSQGDMELTLGRFEDAIASYSAGLADDELSEWLLHSRAITYLNMENETKYRADFEQLLTFASTIDLINDAEYWLAVDKGLLVAVDGLATYTDDVLGFQISYPAEWERPLLGPEDDYDFLIILETPDGYAVVNVFAFTDVFGTTLDDVVTIVSGNVSQTDGLRITQTEFGEVDGIRTYIQSYELTTEDGLGNDVVLLGRQHIVLENNTVWFFTVEAPESQFDATVATFDEIITSIKLLR